jgi:uncharacterized lipoprotein YddW (UPF0748 family)
VAKGSEAPTHISQTRPDLVRKYGNYLWLDPGEPEARDYSLRVIMDVVRRYDVDGVHIDDYFYPYPVKEAGDFPDEPSWQKYLASGGKLPRDDWRRDNINRMIEGLYGEIKREKPRVQFGISPFGIWQPGHPPVVRGFNQYASIYADAKLWLNKGWCDYLSPQLYWKMDAPQQPYGALLDWWIVENLQHRLIVPGNYTSRINSTPATWAVKDIVDQIDATRARSGAAGNVHFSMKALMENRKGIADALRDGVYAGPALVPAVGGLSGKKSPAPRMRLVFQSESIAATWTARSGDTFLWTVYVKRARKWDLVQILPADQRTYVIPLDPQRGRPQAIAVAAVTRTGIEGPRDIQEVREQTTGRDH